MKNFCRLIISIDKIRTNENKLNNLLRQTRVEYLNNKKLLNYFDGTALQVSDSHV